MSTQTYRGHLERETLPEMLYKISQYRVPGVVEARRGTTVKLIFVRDGNAIYARSSDRRDSLGSYLRERGLVGEEDLKRIADARDSSEKRFGVLLMERGLLSPAQLNEAIREQVEHIAWSLFSWEEGEVTFDIQELKEPNAVRIQIPLRQMIVRGIRQERNPKYLVSRLGPSDGVYEPSFDSEDLIDIALDADEYRLLRLVDGRKTLLELAKNGPFDFAGNAKLLYAYRVLELITRKPTSGRDGSTTRAGTLKITYHSGD